MLFLYVAESKKAFVSIYARNVPRTLNLRYHIQFDLVEMCFAQSELTKEDLENQSAPYKG